MNTDTFQYRLMELTALSGEFPADLLWRLGMGGSYGEKMITRLKDERLLKTHYRDKLRGYRLSSVGKKALLAENPERFSFYLTGSSDTNQPRSEPPRRLRLHQTARTYQLLTAAGIEIFRDRKPNLFQAGEPASMQVLPCPVYYHSREIKELGMETVKVNNSRTMGILLSNSTVYVIYYTGDCAMKWSYNTEIKLKAILQHHLNQGVLSRHYRTDTQIHAIMVGTDMYTATVLMRSTGGYHKCCFALDTSYDYFHFVPDTPAGEALLKLLAAPQLLAKLDGLLGSDLQPPDREAFPFEHDAVQEQGIPVLFAYDFDMLEICRFITALRMHQLTGQILCFDFQKATILEYAGDAVSVSTIDLEKFKRRFFN